MKTSNYILLANILILTSCVMNKEESAVKSKAGPAVVQTPGSSTESLQVEESPVVLKTFNQYNATLSKVTGINAADPAISVEYEKIKNSLPGDHPVSTFTPFHQISQTRLAFTYCNNFIDTNATFKAFDYAALTPEVLTKNLLEKFVGSKAILGADTYGKYEAIILKIMNNDAGLDDKGVAIGKLMPVSTGATLKKNLTKMGCTALLASSEFTTI